MIQSDAALDEIGIDYEVVGGSLARVLARVCGVLADDADLEEIPPAWFSVARAAGAMFGEQDGDDITLSWSALASMLRRAYSRAAEIEDVTDFDALDRPARIAWLAVARHAANLYSLEEQEVGKLGTHEATIVDWARTQLAAA